METQGKEGKRVSESPFFKNMLHKAEAYMKKPLRVNQVLNDAYHKASQKKELGTLAGEVWEGLQILFRMIRATVSGQYHGIPTRNIVSALAVVLYFLSPIDFVPDFIPVLGLLDDVALAAWFMTSIKHEMDKFVEWEQGNQAYAGGNGRSPENTDKSFVTPKYEKTEPEGLHAAGKVSATGATDKGPSSKSRTKSGTAEKAADSRTPVVDDDSHEPPTGAAPNGAGEPDVRANTTDSSRQSNRGHDDTTSGGNIR